MNEIALANFYRVLNNEDRFPTEHELAEAAIAAKDELNSLRAPLPEARGAEDETVPKSVLDKLIADWNAETDTELCSVSEMCKILADELSAIIRKHIRHTHAPQTAGTAAEKTAPPVQEAGREPEKGE